MCDRAGPPDHIGTVLAAAVSAGSRRPRPCGRGPASSVSRYTVPSRSNTSVSPTRRRVRHPTEPPGRTTMSSCGAAGDPPAAPAIDVDGLDRRPAADQLRHEGLVQRSRDRHQGHGEVAPDERRARRRPARHASVTILWSPARARTPRRARGIAAGVSTRGCSKARASSRGTGEPRSRAAPAGGRLVTGRISTPGSRKPSAPATPARASAATSASATTATARRADGRRSGRTAVRRPRRPAVRPRPAPRPARAGRASRARSPSWPRPAAASPPRSPSARSWRDLGERPERRRAPRAAARVHDGAATSPCPAGTPSAAAVSASESSSR